MFESYLSYKARDPSIHFWVVGQDEVSNPETRLCIFCHLDHPWPSEEGCLRSGHIDGSVHYCRLPASVFQDQAQTVDSALHGCVYISLPSANEQSWFGSTWISGVKRTTSAEQMDFEHSRFSTLTTRLAEFSSSPDLLPFTLSEGEGIHLCYQLWELLHLHMFHVPFSTPFVWCINPP